MKLKIKSLIMALAVITFFSLSPKVYAENAFSGRDMYFYYSTNQAQFAQQAFNNWGYSCNVPSGTNFTKATIFSKVGSDVCFYVSGHGNVDYIFAGYNGSEQISYSEMAQYTRGFYKFVYTDTCLTGSNGNMAAAFNISNGDGQNHAYLGWNKVTYDNYQYSLFTQRVFTDLTAGSNLNDSLWDAHLMYGATGYSVYGNYFMTK